jgi:D-alanyl-D-alanine carboxypeptidase (penicillin-binding protein 5/6)
MKYVFLFFVSLYPALAFPLEQATDSPLLAASSYALYDYTSEQFLVEQNADTHVSPAHLSKLMTAYVVFDAIKQGKLTLTSVSSHRLMPHACRQMSHACS